MPTAKSANRRGERLRKTKPAARAASTSVERDPSEPRLIKPPKRRFWRRQDKRFRQRPKLPNAWKITKQAAGLLLRNWKLFGGIVLVYGVLSIILVRGLNGGTDVRQLKQQFDTFFHGAFGHLASGLSVFTLLLTSSNSDTSASNAAGAYQLLLFVIVSLALVWSFRQVLSGKSVRIRDGFYQGMYPLIPVLLVLLVMAIQLIPLLIGLWLYVTAVTFSIAITGLEQLLFGVILLGLAAISIYMLCSSLFALYIAALPGMTPMKALRSARGLVRYRRWSIIRKLLFLPIILFIVGALIMLPFILFAAVLAQWVFFVLTMIGLAAIQAYMYTLYRELLNEEA